MHLLKVHFDILRGVVCFALVVSACAVPVGEAVTREAGDDVEMGMENNLPGYGVVVHFNIDTVGVECGFYCYRKFFCHRHHVREGFIGRLVKICMMRFRNNERVPDVYRMNIEKGEDGVVLVDFCAGDFTRDDFAKEAVVHICIIH